MKNNNSQNNEDFHNLRADNEVRKLKLSLKHGMKFGLGDEAYSLPPEIEKVFLDHVEHFELAHQDAKQIKLYDFIGNPEFRPAHALKDAELKHELKRIEEILFRNALNCTCIYDVDDRVYYKFLTEELFQHEISEVRIPGMTLNFIYEEFHPNFAMDILTESEAFFKRFFDKVNLERNEDVVIGIQNKKQLCNFRSAFSQFKNPEVKFSNTQITGEKATIDFELQVDGVIDGSTEIKSLKDAGIIFFDLSENYCTIIEVKMNSLMEI